MTQKSKIKQQNMSSKNVLNQESQTQISIRAPLYRKITILPIPCPNPAEGQHLTDTFFN